MHSAELRAAVPELLIARGPGGAFTAELLAALPDEAARRAARRVLNEWRGRTVYVPHDDFAARVILARRLFDSGLPAESVLASLVNRCGCSRRAALRAFKRALSFGPRILESRPPAG